MCSPLLLLSQLLTSATTIVVVILFDIIIICFRRAALLHVDDGARPAYLDLLVASTASRAQRSDVGSLARLLSIGFIHVLHFLF